MQDALYRTGEAAEPGDRGQEINARAYTHTLALIVVIKGCVCVCVQMVCVRFNYGAEAIWCGGG